MPILSIEEFWNIVEDSYNIDHLKQEKNLIQLLLGRQISDIFAFSEYQSTLTGLLDKWYCYDHLFDLMSNELGVYMSDDVWEYRRGHIVMLGKKMYDMAMDNPIGFVEILKSGKFGDPENISHEFWALKYQILEKKIGDGNAWMEDHLDEEAIAYIQSVCDNLMLDNYIKKWGFDPAINSDCLNGIKFCFTGKLNSMTRKEAQSLVSKHGAIAKNNVTKDLNFLVSNSFHQSVKLSNARKYGTLIMNEHEFIAMMNRFT